MFKVLTVHTKINYCSPRVIQEFESGEAVWTRTGKQVCYWTKSIHLPEHIRASIT